MTRIYNRRNIEEELEEDGIRLSTVEKFVDTFIKKELINKSDLIISYEDLKSWFKRYCMEIPHDTKNRLEKKLIYYTTYGYDIIDLIFRDVVANKLKDKYDDVNKEFVGIGFYRSAPRGEVRSYENINYAEQNELNRYRINKNLIQFMDMVIVFSLNDRNGNGLTFIELHKRYIEWLDGHSIKIQKNEKTLKYFMKYIMMYYNLDIHYMLINQKKQREYIVRATKNRKLQELEQMSNKMS